MGGGGGKSPSVPDPEPIEVPAPAPNPVDTSAQEAGNNERRQRAAARGHSASVLTKATGLGDTATTSKKNLLGE